MQYDAVIVASGSGSRLSLGYNKVFYRFKDGKTILDKAIHLFLEDDDCQKVIVVTKPDDFAKVELRPKMQLTKGGDTRQKSVYAGLKLTASPYVLVHDAARPYLDIADLKGLKDTLQKEDAAILAVKAKDTIKTVRDGYIQKTLDRNNIYLAQTPQGAKSHILKAAYEKALNTDIPFTDEASILEYCGIAVKIVDGNYRNIKITYKEDLDDF